MRRSPLGRGARIVLLAGAAILSTAGAANAQDRSLAREAVYSIPAQPAGDALNAFSRQSGFRILFPYDAVEGKKVRGVRGRMSAELALRQLLQDTGLRIVSRQNGVITLAALAKVQQAPAAQGGPIDPGEADPGSPPAEVESAAAEIVVTATRRAERLLDVPSSMQALTGQDLERMGAVNFADYARSVAGVAFLDSGPGRTQIFIRGVSTGGDVDIGKESTVGVYIDETPVSEGSSQPDLKLYDIDRVEVLRGPQGTLYGSGSLGGTVRILTKQPDFREASSFVQLTGSTTRKGGENGAVNGWLNVPLSDAAAIRVVGYALHNDGFLDHGYTGEKDINDETTYGGRIALRVQPSSRVNAVLTGVYQNIEAGAYQRVTDHYPDLIIDQSAPEPFKDRYGIVNLKVDIDLDFANLTSSSSYFNRRRYFENDIDYFLEFLGIPKGLSQLVYRAKTLSQEVRLASSEGDRLGWIVGGFYLDRDDSYHQNINPADVPPPANPADFAFFGETFAKIRQLAGFGELSYELLPSLTATLGLRVSNVRRDIRSVREGALAGSSSLSGDFSQTSTTPKANLSYKPTDDSLIYVQAAKGFRIGGVNPGLPLCDSCAVQLPDDFDSDSIWNYEVGTKFQLFDRRLSVAAAAFYLDWKNIQLNVNREDGFNGITNAGDARVKGVEIEANGRVGRELRFGGQVTYTHGRMRNVAPGLENVIATGQALPDVAPWMAAAHVEWGKPVFGDGQVYVRGDLQYVGSRESALGDANSTRLPDYALLNLRVGLDVGQFETALFVTNLTDKRAILTRSTQEGLRNGQPLLLDRVSVNVPRTIGISVARRF